MNYLRRATTFIILMSIALTIAILQPAFSIQPSESPEAGEILTQSQFSPSADNLLQQGIQEYDAGQFVHAIAFWQESLALFTNQNDLLNQALILSNLSLAYQRLGHWDDAEKAITQGLNILQQQPSSNTLVALDIYAKALNTMGRLQWSQGLIEEALSSWQDAETKYAQAHQTIGVLGSRLNQAKALQALGLSVQAERLLQNVYDELSDMPDSPTRAAGLRSLGNALRRLGVLDQSRDALQASLSVVTQTLESQGATHLDLGNTERALGDRAIAISRDEDAQTHYQQAIENYQNSARVANSPLIQMQAQVNQLSLYVAIEEFNAAIQQWKQIQPEFANLPLRNSVLLMRLNATRSLLKINSEFFQSASSLSDSSLMWSAIAQFTADTVTQARALQDLRAQSYALGQLGEVYEHMEQWDDARSLTQQALQISENTQAPDIRYRWEWQLGRIFAKQGHPDAALPIYQQAVETLETIRNNLLFIDSDVQFSFRDNVEPIYRETIDLLLQSPNASSHDLKEAIDLLDALQLAELENFLRCNLTLSVSLTESEVDETAATIYPIILGDRLEVILSVPGQDLSRHTVNVPKEDIDNMVKDLSYNLRLRRFTSDLRRDSKTLYRWLIQPFESVLDADLTLNESPIKTLVFVLDSGLRELSMSVLQDEQRNRYLIERYAIAIAPSLQLIEPQPLTRPLKVLVAGSDQELDHPFRDTPYPALKNVRDEITAIKALVRADELFNNDFTKANLEAKLKTESFSVLHLATHGSFSSDPERTYIVLTGGSLKAKELDALLRSDDVSRNAVQLIVFSACETAQGDNRAVLGLAGLTVQAGARSAIATLWSVEDESAAVIMGEFYRELAQNPEISRAEALRRAQVSLWEIDDQRNVDWHPPYYWAPYTLVGNWL
ncbi:MAG: CHAT domain-containing protein [Elainellaceae cyanobacterium]